jgi:DeoR family transcriptional regulator, aga operon transcriptional repressor
MTRAERLTALLERLVEQGRIDVEHSAQFFGVSAATIRRDLDHLADQQLLSRTHGGAVPNSTSYDLPLRYKSMNRAESKTRIAQRAVEMMWPGCTVAMNGGTTTVEIARTIPTSPPLHNGITIVTNAINIATEMTVRPYIKIVVCGGVARPQSYELVGSLASETLTQLTSDICFLGATGIDADGGVTTDDEGESAINRIMVTRAKKAVVVVDATKFGEVGFSRICRLDEVSAVLTDADADPEQVARMRDHGVDVILC